MDSMWTQFYAFPSILAITLSLYLLVKFGHQTTVRSMKKEDSSALSQLLMRAESLKLAQCGLTRHIVSGSDVFVQKQSWSFHLYHYRGTFEAKGQAFEFAPGWMSLIPPGISVSWRYPRVATHYYVHFRVSPATQTDLPMVLPNSSQKAYILKVTEEIINLFPRHPKAASVRLHNLLWKILLGESTPPGKSGDTNSALQIALSIIRNELDQKLRIRDLAKRCGISTGHLNRLFQKEMNMTTQEYVQIQRLQLAEHLLRHSDQPVISVASQTGFDDLQAFNKFIRRRTGSSPSGIRISADNRERL